MSRSLRNYDEDVYKRQCRTRLVDGKPYVVEYTYMPTDFITGITEDVVKMCIRDR